MMTLMTHFGLTMAVYRHFTRKFVSTDGTEYQWTHRPSAEREWMVSDCDWSACEYSMAN